MKSGPSDQESRFLSDKQDVDTVFHEKMSSVKAFAFDGSVAGVFEDMATRSIPLYGELQRTTARIAENFAAPGTRIYDLGCATGTTLLCLAHRITDPSIEIVGVDSSQAMLDRCRVRLHQFGFSDRIRLENADAVSFPLTGASCVIAHYTLQFLPVAQRLGLLRAICSALTPGGVLLLSEKATEGDSVLDAVINSLYYDFKKRNGYSELEIAQKREALENVLIPLSVTETKELLAEAGFSKTVLLSKCFQFCSFIAYN